MNAQEYINATVAERKSVILEEAKKIAVPDLNDKLKDTYAYSQVINKFIREVIEIEVTKDNQLDQKSIFFEDNIHKAVNKQIANFLPIAIDRLKEVRPSINKLQKSRKNLYEVSGAVELAFANKISRTLSTTMGGLWEKIANVSPYAINPEIEFGLKLKGIDLIALNKNTNNLEYLQLKTQRNTLSGSQSDRANSELSLHANPVFCACFDTKTNWTYKNKAGIERVCGNEFWSRIGMDHDTVLTSIIILIKTLEEEYVKMLGIAE